MAHLCHCDEKTGGCGKGTTGMNELQTMKPVDGKIVAKVFVRYRARLLKNHHPKGYEDEWLDKGAEITVMWMPHQCFYLNGPYGCFNSSAKEGKDFEFIMEGAK